MASEVGSGQVAIVPTFKGFRKGVTAEVDGSIKTAASRFTAGFSKTGGDAGKGFSSAFKSSTKDLTAVGLKQATADVAKSSRELATVRLKEQDAAGKVRLAETQLGEARRKYASDSSQVIRAEERLASVQRAHLSTQAAVVSSTNRLASAQHSLRNATEDVSSAAGKQGSIFRNLSSNAGSYFRNAGADAAGSFGSGFRSTVGQIFTGAFLANIATGVAREGVQIASQAAVAGLRYGMESVGLASELEQSVGAISAVFKDQAPIIDAFSKNAATDVGLARGAYQQFATVVGAQLKNLGVPMDQVGQKTNDLITLGADLSAQFGGSTSDAVSALSSLLRGERDPIERYGVSIKQVDIDARKTAMGLDELTGEADRQAEIAATLGILWEQTADAQGTFFRETDTYAHKTQVLNAQLADAKTRLGEALLPAMTSVADYAGNTLIPRFDDFIDRVGPKFAEAFEAASPQIQELEDKLSPLVDKLVDASIDGIPGFIQGMTDIVSAAPEWIDAFKEIDQAVYDFDTEFKNLQTDLQNAREDRINWFEDLLAPGTVEPSSEFANTAKDAWYGFGSEVGTSFNTGTTSGLQMGAGATQESAVKLAQDAVAAAAAKANGALIGESIASGLATGLSLRDQQVTAAAEQLVMRTVNAAKKKAEVNSPSKLMARELGAPLAEGVAFGIKQGQPMVDRAIASMIASPGAAAVPTLGGGAAGLGAEGAPAIYVQNPFTGEYLLAQVDARADATVGSYDQSQTVRRSMGQRGTPG